LEGYIILVEAKYGNTYDSDISNETFLIMEKAGKKYKIRLNNRLADLAKIEQEIKDMQIEIDKDRAEIVKDRAEIDILDQKLINTLNKISSQDVKTNERIRNLVIETKVLFFKY
jgi:peptidoglycan hydrolase CwlO-like protein